MAMRLDRPTRGRDSLSASLANECRTMSPKSLLPESARKRDVAVTYLIQRGLLAIRWLAVPLLFGLMIVLALFSVKLIQELFQLFAKILTLSDSELILLGTRNCLSLVAEF